MKHYGITTITLLCCAFANVMQAQMSAWRIVDGPGKGAVLRGFGERNVQDLYYGAFGHVADPDRCKSLHYHGTLYGLTDPNQSACGWGTVIPVPFPPESASEAAADLEEVLDYIYAQVDQDLAIKLGEILDMMDAAAASGCYTVVNALGNAFSEELQSYFSMASYDSLFNPMVQDLTEYVNSRLAALEPAPFFPSIAARQVQILRRIGSDTRGRLLDAGPRISLRVGEMLTLQMLAEAGMVNPLFLWQYKWKGKAEGEIPSAAALAVYANFITMVAYYNTSLRLTGLVRDPSSGQLYRDTIMVNWSDRNY